MDESQHYGNYHEIAALAAIQQPALNVFVETIDKHPGASRKDSTERTGMPASRTPESQRGTRSPPPTRLCLQAVAHPTDTGRHLCLIAANRTPCRRNQ